MTEICSPVYRMDGVRCLFCEATSSDEAEEKCHFKQQEEVDAEGE